MLFYTDMEVIMAVVGIDFALGIAELIKISAGLKKG